MRSGKLIKRYANFNCAWIGSDTVRVCAAGAVIQDHGQGYYRIKVHIERGEETLWRGTIPWFGNRDVAAIACWIKHVEDAAYVVEEGYPRCRCPVRGSDLLVIETGRFLRRYP
jgi:hypothetical protein